MPSGEPDSQRAYQVALFGVIGCGKSSIINLLAGEPVAKVSTGVQPCTKRAQWFPISIGEKTFQLWDTMGFNPAEAEDTDPLSPYEQAHALLRNMQDGIDLILLCAQRDGVNASLCHLYWVLNDFFFRRQARIALVLTHFDVPDPGWWERNVHGIAERCGTAVRLPLPVCITTIPDDPEQFKGALWELQTLLQTRAVSQAPTKLPDLLSDVTIEDAAASLKSHSRLTLLDAQRLIKHLRSPRRPFHAILFGESGVGKSSIINLMSGISVADVSDGLDSVTPSFRHYEINTGSHQFLVWDTVGFNGVYKGKDMTEMALKNAAHLVRDLHSKGGVDLLVFCKKDGRLSPSELNCFRIFHEFLCEGQTPVAFIITHLEKHSRMEEWWEKNGEYLVENCKLKRGAVAGHACITAAQDDPYDQGLRDRRSLSRQQVQAMFNDSVSYGDAFRKDVEVWVMSFLKKLMGMIKWSPTEKKNLVARLMKRCELTRDQAEELLRSRELPASETTDSAPL